MGMGWKDWTNLNKHGKPHPDKGKGGIGGHAWTNRKANQDKTGKGKGK